MQASAFDPDVAVREARFGARPLAAGGVRFRLWAPSQSRVKLHILGRGEPRVMRALAAGWHEWIDPDARAGDRYLYRLEDGQEIPDPASRFQPEDVDGALPACSQGEKCFEVINTGERHGGDAFLSEET